MLLFQLHEDRVANCLVGVALPTTRDAFTFHPITHRQLSFVNMYRFLRNSLLKPEHVAFVLACVVPSKTHRSKGRVVIGLDHHYAQSAHELLQFIVNCSIRLINGLVFVNNIFLKSSNVTLLGCCWLMTFAIKFCCVWSPITSSVDDILRNVPDVTRKITWLFAKKFFVAIVLFSLCLLFGESTLSRAVAFLLLFELPIVWQQWLLAGFDPMVKQSKHNSLRSPFVVRRQLPKSLSVKLFARQIQLFLSMIIIGLMLVVFILISNLIVDL